MDKVSLILKPSTRTTWKSDLPPKPERLTDPREARGFDRRLLPVQLPAGEVEQEVLPQLTDGVRGTKIDKQV